MAGRQLQRLLKEQLPAVESDEEEITTSEDDEDEEESKPAFNPFSLLTDDEDEGNSSAEESSAESEAEVAPPPAAQKPAPPPLKGRREEEDLDAILKELNITPISPEELAAGGAQSSSNSSSSRPLLAVNSSNLKAEEELKRMFGSMGMRGGREDDDPSAAYAGASRRIRRLAARGALRPRPGMALRQGVLINPRGTWPRPDGSVALKACGPDSEGNPTFKIDYSGNYHAVQQLYEECQATFDPNAIAALLRAHPYHLDALLTMSDVYRAMGEHSSADELIERCVYVLECGWPPGFLSAASNGTARVEYNENNAPLFIALFRYIQTLGRRGLHRTALETCKLLLQLDSDDPMGVLQTIDYFAVRSGQYDYLQRFVESGSSSSSALLPNMVYSLALARWYEEQEKKQGNDKSEELLVKAVLLHPLVVTKLQAKLGEQGVGKDSRWTAALAHPLLAQASDGGNPGLGHLVDLFVERQAALWKAGPLQEWLLGGVRRACGCNAADLPDGLSAGDWAAIRQQAYPESDTNAYSHLRLHEFSDTAPRLPAEEIHGIGGGAGGIPQEIDEAQLMAELEQLAAAGGGGVEGLRDAHPLMALIRSLMPWVAEGQQPDYEREDEDREE